MLCGIAGEAGLDVEGYRGALLRGTYTDKVKEETAYSRDVLQVSGVPTVYLDGKQVAVETYTKEEMIQILQQGPEVDGCG